MNRVLVANRGEIAVRIIRAATTSGSRPWRSTPTADAGAPHVRMADDAVAIGPPPAGKAYLDMSAIVEAARTSGRRRRPPRLRVPRRARRLRVGGRGRRAALRRSQARAHRADGRQGAGARGGRGAAACRPSRAATARSPTRRGRGRGRQDRLPGGAQGGRRRRRARHPDRARRGDAAQPVHDRRPRGRRCVRRRTALRRALHQPSAPRRGPGARRRGADDPPARARMLPAAAAPEGGRGDARPQARGRHARRALRGRDRPVRRDRLPRAQARWSSSSTPPAASSSSSR